MSTKTFWVNFKKQLCPFNQFQNNSIILTNQIFTNIRNKIFILELLVLAIKGEYIIYLFEVIHKELIVFYNDYLQVLVFPRRLTNQYLYRLFKYLFDYLGIFIFPNYLFVPFYTFKLSFKQGFAPLESVKSLLILKIPFYVILK